MSPTLHNSFLLMFMRMVLVVPVMALVSSRLYPSTWQEIGQLKQVEQRLLLWRSLGCGGLMFSYLALLYISIGLIPTGIALTLFFIYPVFTALFSWRWFGDRPTLFRWGIMGLVFLGSILTLPPVNATVDNSHWLGIATGIASGIVYALYTVIAQKSVEILHPVPFTWISFATALVLSAASLLFWHQPAANLAWTPLWIGGFLSAIVTFAGHLMTNIGIQRIGAATAAMIGATNPALTVVLAWLTIQETLSAWQIAGVAIVTLSVVMLGRERYAAKVG